jgi:hypothetical protein
MTAAHKFVCSILLLTLLVTQGCNKKKNKAAVPLKMQAPTVAVTLPSEIPLTQEPEETQPPLVEKPTPTPPAKAKTKAKKPARNSTKKATPAATPAATPQTTQGNQTVASAKLPENPAEAVPETMIAAAVPNAQLVQQKEDTTRMVDATENALKGLTRSLSDEEKSMKRQIQSYVRQSRKATEDGDFERAYNLAKKAQILADALIKK